MKIIGKWLFAFSLILTSFLASTYEWNVPDYQYDQTVTFSDFDEYYKKELEISKSENAREGNEERLVRYSDTKTPIAILYVHGFGASRAEGEDVIDKVADHFQANLYYVRLPGHGTDVEDHKKVTFDKYLQDAETALQMATQLGDQVILVGTSMGGLISTYLAAKHPELISGVILASPFYNFPDPTANLFRFTWGSSFINAAMGEIRKSKEQDPKDEAYKYWYRDQYYASIKHLMNLKRFVEKEDSIHKIQDPVLMFYFYKSEEEQDRSASVKAMLENFQKIQSNPLNKAVNVEKGEHVLMSKFSKTDKPLLFQETTDFITKVTGVIAPKTGLKKPKG
ncbi:alpha/beta hydrolase [Leptospira idonii]|uniref:Alpha/beta hydrolase n=1 Tax=Leptospira idonii TaxID=1193500 RepID=A0A4R9M0Q7_9LEPT|nr:alpha/beta hydrolase [Leptospira idonii]TGN19247.1 alpha/beta hydrolase [Leptospira idonii]